MAQDPRPEIGVALTALRSIKVGSEIELDEVASLVRQAIQSLEQAHRSCSNVEKLLQ